jgi:hypothetical protein
VTTVWRIAVILGCAAAATACGSSHGQSHAQPQPPADAAIWSDLTRVSVDVDQPSVAPVPGSKHTPTIFATPAQLATVTKALNADHIRKAKHTTTSNDCTGGIVIKIKIAQRHRGPTVLNAYHCANTVTGNIAGNLTGFLNRIGVSTP